MNQKGAWKAASRAKCPKCRKGKMFESGWLSIRFAKMPERCAHCNFRFELEPGFWFGAMYVSYMISVAIFITVFASVYIFLNDPELEVYILSIIIISVILYPVTFRVSRVVFLHVFGGVKYNPESDS